MQLPAPPDLSIAARFLRRMAPMQSHQDRCNFQAAARSLEGINLSHDNALVIYDYPVWWNGRLVGHVQFMVNADESGVHSSTRFIETEEI